MARYRQLMVGDDTRWHLMSPTGPLEALRIAWMLWRYPERVAALVGVRNEYVLAIIGEGSDPMTSDPVDPVESSSGVPMDDFHPVESDAESSEPCEMRESNGAVTPTCALPQKLLAGMHTFIMVATRNGMSVESREHVVCMMPGSDSHASMYCDVQGLTAKAL